VLIVGELINSSRKAVRLAIEGRDSAAIQRLALSQAAAGADYIDINCGTRIDDEEETMQWLVQCIQEVCDAPLCIDSPAAGALAAGLEAAQRSDRPIMLNSITAESGRYAAVLPLVRKYKAKVVALLMDDSGMPETAADRIRIAGKLIGDLIRDGIPPGDIYLDPLVKPISTGNSFGRDVHEAVRYISERYPEVHKICGLSNISFGLPNRKILNQIFMIQAMTAGMDAYILDPLDRTMMGLLYGSRALLGTDPYCAGYLKAHRSGLYA
jgi:5-methyltetrahydrofolate--homocysteine methyltransferase